MIFQVLRLILIVKKIYHVVVAQIWQNESEDEDEDVLK